MLLLANDNTAKVRHGLPFNKEPYTLAVHIACFVAHTANIVLNYYTNADLSPQNLSNLIIHQQIFVVLQLVDDFCY